MSRLRNTTDHRVALGPGANLFYSFQDFGVFRLNSPMHGHVFNRIFTQEDQRVPDVVCLVDRFGNLLHHRPLLLGTDARGASINRTGIFHSPFRLGIVFGPAHSALDESETCWYNLPPSAYLPGPAPCHGFLETA